MGVKPPQGKFRLEIVEVTRIDKENVEPVIKVVEKEVIKEVEKIVYQDDPKLLEQLNTVLKENGDLRKQISKIPEQKIIEKKVDVIIEKLTYSIKREIAIGAGTFIIGVLLCYLTKK